MRSVAADAAAADAPIRWGFIGTGNIAMAMAQQLARRSDSRREVIASASGKSAAMLEPKRVQYASMTFPSGVDFLSLN